MAKTVKELTAEILRADNARINAESKDQPRDERGRFGSGSGGGGGGGGGTTHSGSGPKVNQYGTGRDGDRTTMDEKTYRAEAAGWKAHGYTEISHHQERAQNWTTHDNPKTDMRIMVHHDTVAGTRPEDMYRRSGTHRVNGPYKLSPNIAEI